MHFKRARKTKTVLFVGLNDGCDPKLIIEELMKHAKCIEDITAGVFPEGTVDRTKTPITITTEKLPQFKGDQFIFMHSSRNLLEFLDYAKVADIICPILSVKNVNLQEFRLNEDKSNAFDELGLTMITSLRSQGHGVIIPIVQDLHLLQQ